MSTKRKSTGGKKNRAKSRKVEYDEEDISSEHDSEVDDGEVGSNADGEDATEDALADVSNMPELPAPEVNRVFFRMPTRRETWRSRIRCEGRAMPPLILYRLISSSFKRKADVRDI